MISKRIFCNRGIFFFFFLSLKRLTQFPAPTLKRQPSDNVASLWGKILLRSKIQEKNAENNLLENQSNIKGTNGACAFTLHPHRNQPKEQLKK